MTTNECLIQVGGRFLAVIQIELRLGGAGRGGAGRNPRGYVRVTARPERVGALTARPQPYPTRPTNIASLID